MQRIGETKLAKFSNGRYVYLLRCLRALLIFYQMEEYWKTRPTKVPRPATTSTQPASGHTMNEFESEFDRLRKTMLAQKDVDEDGGWRAELRRYLGEIPADVFVETDIIKWWEVNNLFYSIFILF